MPVAAMIEYLIVVLTKLHLDLRIGDDLLQRESDFFQGVPGLDSAIDICLRPLRESVVGVALPKSISPTVIGVNDEVGTASTKPILF